MRWSARYLPARRAGFQDGLHSGRQGPEDFDKVLPDIQAAANGHANSLGRHLINGHVRFGHPSIVVRHESLRVQKLG